MCCSSRHSTIYGAGNVFSCVSARGSKLKDIIKRLANAEKLPPQNKDHQLKGTLKDCRECHIEPDWLLVYRIEGSELCLIRTGTHSDLF